MKIKGLRKASVFGFLLLFLLYVHVSSETDGTDWVVVSHSPEIYNYGVAATGVGENIYILNSSTSPPPYCKFWRYNPADNSWDNLVVPKDGWKTVWAKNGTCLTWDNGDYIYALFGGSYGDTGSDARYYFYRYSISGDNWEQLENTPRGQGAGDAITWVPGSVLGTQTDWIYAIVGAKWGSNQTTFCRYNISGDSWETLIYNPSWSGEGSDDGSSLVWAGGDYLYALQGEWHETNENVDRAFARFDLTDNTWDDLPDIPEEGGVGDGGSLVWAGGGYSDNIYALGGGYVGPGETPGDNFYCYNISENSWTQLDSLPYGITDQNGPRLGYANENIYCWRGYYNASQGDPDVLWAYAVPEIVPQRGVLVSISPSQGGGVPGATLEYLVTVGNTGNVTDNYILENSDTENWDLVLDNERFEDVAPGENRETTLTITILDNENLIGVKNNITVTATSQENSEVSDNASCIAYVAGETIFDLDLAVGWNLISIPLLLENQTRGAIFENVTHFMSGWTGTGYYTPGMSDNLEPGEGYWVWVSTPTTIELRGLPLDFTLEPDAGWNLIGIPIFVPPLDNRERGAIFENVTHFMSGWTGTGYYTPGMSDNLEPGEGYWVWVPTSTEITLP